MSKIDNACEALNLKEVRELHVRQALVEMHAFLVMILGDDKHAMSKWMHNPKKSLNDKAPRDLLGSTEGITRIFKVLRRELEMDSLIG